MIEAQTHTQPHTNTLQIYIHIYFYIVSVCLSVCLSVRKGDHALTAEPIDFIFDMHIDVIPRSDIGILDFSFLTIKGHLWTKLK